VPVRVAVGSSTYQEGTVELTELEQVAYVVRREGRRLVMTDLGGQTRSRRIRAPGARRAGRGDDPGRVTQDAEAAEADERESGRRETNPSEGT
jgi:hypothetical protein